MLSSINNVRIDGTGQKAMVFAHGFGCDQTMWRFVEPAFRGDFQTVLYDLTGSGKSDVSKYDMGRHGSLVGHSQDLVAILTELQVIL